MKILVTGSNGLLGQKLTQLFLDTGIPAVATGIGPDRFPGGGKYTYAELDITNEASVEQVVAAHRPDVIIHAAAITNVDTCHSAPEDCRKVNVEGTRYLLRAAERAGAHFVYVSTDFVFNGLAGPYHEDDLPDPVSIYGSSKRDAEDLVKASATSWSIVRTILVYGVTAQMSRSNIILWVKNSLSEGKTIRVVNDQWRMPTLAEDLARACMNIAQARAEGIFHISGNEMLSVYQIACEVAAHWNLNQELIVPVPSETLNQEAKRPPKTGFILDKARQVLDYRPHSLQEGLRLVDAQLKAGNG
jgi:dTDP-4-dehydrorhamnose reductase